MYGAVEVAEDNIGSTSFVKNIEYDYWMYTYAYMRRDMQLSIGITCHIARIR